MDWLLPVFFLGVLVVLTILWSQAFKGQFQAGWDVVPGESWWRRILRIGGGVSLGALMAIGIMWLWSGDFPLDWLIAAAIGASIAAALVILIGLRQSHGRA